MITGATGFVGGALASALVADGATVHALVRRPDAVLPTGAKPVVMPATAAELADRVATLAPEVVFHLATHFVGVHTATDVEPLIAANVLFGTQLAQALSVTPPRLLVNVGTAWQHGEDGEYAPAALYAATKQAMEDILRFYAGAFPVANVKLFDTYGPADTRGKLLAILDRASRDGRPLDLSPGEQLIDLLHVDDVVAALRAAPEGDWSAASGAAVPLRELVARFERITGRGVPVNWGAREYRAREMFTPWNAGPRVPGWAPQITLDDGIKELYA